MPVLAKFLSTKFVAHSNCSYKDHLFFLLSGEKFLKFYWFDAYEDRFKQPGRVGQGCWTVELLRTSVASL